MVRWSVTLSLKSMKNSLLRVLNDLDSAGRGRYRDEEEDTGMRRKKEGGTRDEKEEGMRRNKGRGGTRDEEERGTRRKER